ncbi:MAG TPA: DUF167 domain-containing protein [Acidobacteriaceae bacterium]|nr:DUF167 domain-containing protein [Acidobacteriaceae bacterium]
MNLPVTDTRDGARFAVRVTPRASRTAIAGVTGEGPDTALKIALHAPPVEGRANAALIEFLADLLHVRRSDIEIAAGAYGRTKHILIRNHAAAEITSAIQAAIDGAKK